MRFGSWNERDNPDLPDTQVRSDARRVKRRFRGASIIGCQEIGEAQDHRALHAVFGTRWRQVANTQATPILFNRFRFVLHGWDYVQTHKGVAHVTPHRGFVRALFSVRRRPGLDPFYVYNTHFVSKPGSSQQRREFYAIHLAKMQADIAAHREHDIFVLGDMNKREVPEFSPDQRQLVHHWLDHVVYIPAAGGAGNVVKVLDTFVMHGDLFTDHQPIGATVRLDARSIA